MSSHWGVSKFSRSGIAHRWTRFVGCATATAFSCGLHEAVRMLEFEVPSKWRWKKKCKKCLRAEEAEDAD